jgi:hypothetical protein
MVKVIQVTVLFIFSSFYLYDNFSLVSLNFKSEFKQNPASKCLNPFIKKILLEGRGGTQKVFEHDLYSLKWIPSKELQINFLVIHSFSEKIISFFFVCNKISNKYITFKFSIFL